MTCCAGGLCVRYDMVVRARPGARYRCGFRYAAQSPRLVVLLPVERVEILPAYVPRWRPVHIVFCSDSECLPARGFHPSPEYAPSEEYTAVGVIRSWGRRVAVLAGRYTDVFVETSDPRGAYEALMEARRVAEEAGVCDALAAAGVA